MMNSNIYRFIHRVTFGETNMVGNVYFAEFANWQGACRENFLHDHAPSIVQRLTSAELALVTLSMSVDFFEQCYAGDVVSIEMTGRPLASNSRLEMSFSYQREGVIVAQGKQTVACLIRQGEEYILAPIPAELLAALREFD